MEHLSAASLMRHPFQVFSSRPDVTSGAALPEQAIQKRVAGGSSS